MSQSKVSREVYRDVAAERGRQVAKWGTETALRGSFGSFTEYAGWKYLIAGEEVGEVARAVLEHQPLQNQAYLGHLYEECIQTAAVFLALAEGVALEMEA